MNLNLSGKNAFVGGSSRGIGKAIAMELSVLGANVTLVSRSEESLKKALADLDVSQGQEHDYLALDFSMPEMIASKVMKYMEDKKKVFHILINNTGGPKGGPITEAKSDEFVQAYQNHLVCNQLLSQACLLGMKEAGYGRIINITSTSVKEPIPGLGVSNTTRWAVASWAKTWAGEVAQFGITVNTVLPGFTATSRLDEIISSRAGKAGISKDEAANKMKATVPMNRFGEPSEMANAVAFLASPAAAYITGIVMPVDGGRLKSV